MGSLFSPVPLPAPYFCRVRIHMSLLCASVQSPTVLSLPLDKLYPLKHIQGLPIPITHP